MGWVFTAVVTTRRGSAGFFSDVHNLHPFCRNRMGGGIPSLPGAARFTAKNLILEQRDRVWPHFQQELAALDRSLHLSKHPPVPWQMED